MSRDRATGHAQLTSARFCQQMCEIPSPCVHAASTSFLLDGGSLPPDQQMCEIPGPCFKAVFTGLLLGHSSLPPDFAHGFVQSRALALMRYVQFFLLGDGFAAPSTRFCQQMCEIPSPCFNAVFTGFLLDHNSLPPDFARGFAQSRALALTRHAHFFSSVTASRLPPPDFCQQRAEIPSPCFNAVFTGFFLDHSSLPPDFARGFVQSRAIALTRYVQFFCSVTASRLPPPDSASRELKPLALALMRYIQAFCSITAHFRQILPVDLCNPEPLHSRGTCSYFCSVTASRLPPPDFASRCVKSLALALTRYLQAFCSVTAHFRQILPVDLCNPEPLFSRGVNKVFVLSN